MISNENTAEISWKFSTRYISREKYREISWYKILNTSMVEYSRYSY